MQSKWGCGLPNIPFYGAVAPHIHAKRQACLRSQDLSLISSPISAGLIYHGQGPWSSGCRVMAGSSIVLSLDPVRDNDPVGGIVILDI